MTDTTRPVSAQCGNNLNAESVDDLLTDVLQLTAEVSALRERVSIWERVLEAKGIPATEATRRLTKTDQQDPLFAVERERLLRDVLESLRSPGTPRGG